MFPTAIALSQLAKRRLIASLILLFLICAASSQNADHSTLPRLTSERVSDPGWWPTKGAAARSEYAGSAACAACHRNIAESQAETPMFKAASRAEDAATLKLHPYLQFIESDFRYALARQDDRVMLRIENNGHVLSAPLLWAMGNGEIGQTYLLKKGDTYYESRLSYFPSISDLDISPGHSHKSPTSLISAVGMPQTPVTVQRCFGCHTTASTVSGVFDPENATPGIGCEGCHGPSANHVKAEEQGKSDAPIPFNPRTLAPHNSVDFCGACHRTTADVAVETSDNLGVNGIRFSAYRLERSLCWGASGDARITCTACHDPHKPLVTDMASYDSKCLQCHAKTRQLPKANQAQACTVAANDCASCHMPKYELKAAHATMTDHFIRIVQPGEEYRR
jgi:Cytochrome c3